MDKNYDQKAISLNNRATELIHKEPDSALTLLNKAIDIDETYHVAHMNKVNIYVSKGDFDQAIKSAEQGVNSKPELAESVTMLGMLYDYTGHRNKAQEQYSRALDIYNSRLKNSDQDKKENRVNKAHTLLLLDRTSEGKNEVDKLITEYPDDMTIQMLVDFEKDKYLNGLFGQE